MRRSSGVPIEHEEQVGFVNWFRRNFPGVLIYAVPNGGWRGIKAGKELKDEGVVAGMPDLHIPDWRVWVEMKRTKGGQISDEQQEVADYLTDIGHTVFFAKGARHASEQITNYVKARNADERVGGDAGIEL